MPRIRLVTIVVALLLGAGLLAAPGAGAVPAGPGVAAGAAKEPRTISIAGKEPRPNRFFVKGRVSPVTHPAKAVVQRKNCSTRSCRWFAWKTFRTGDDGRYRVRVEAPGDDQRRVYYRVHTPPTQRFKAATSKAIYIYSVA